METIIDYLKKNKDVSFNQLEFNQIDVLLCSILAYAYIKPFKRKIPFNKFLNKIVTEKDNQKHGHMIHVVDEVYSILNGGLRYKNVKVSNFTKITDDKTQFAACVFIFKNNKVVAFEGTDNSTIGWYENFRLGYQYPTFTQSLSGMYLNDAIGRFDKNIIICGHSKGGNLAIASSMLIEEKKRNKIKTIYNFDGPGLLKKQIESEEFKLIKDKIINVLPQSSYIGSLFYNNGKVIHVESIEKMLDIHYPNSWIIEGNKFKKSEESVVSNKIHQVTCDFISNFDLSVLKQNIERFIETIDVLNDKNKTVELTTFKNAFQVVKDDKTLTNNIFKIMFKLVAYSFIFKKKNDCSTYCGVDCTKCLKVDKCKGCISTLGHPLKLNCFIAELIKNSSYDKYLEIKQKLIKEILDLQIEGISQIEDLIPLHGREVNLPINVGDNKNYLLENDQIYLGTQIIKQDNSGYYGIACNLEMILITEYDLNFKNAHVVIYKQLKNLI